MHPYWCTVETLHLMHLLVLSSPLWRHRWLQVCLGHIPPVQGTERQHQALPGHIQRDHHWIRRKFGIWLPLHLQGPSSSEPEQLDIMQHVQKLTFCFVFNRKMKRSWSMGRLPLFCARQGSKRTSLASHQEAPASPAAPLRSVGAFHHYHWGILM